MPRERNRLLRPVVAFPLLTGQAGAVPATPPELHKLLVLDSHHPTLDTEHLVRIIYTNNF